MGRDLIELIEGVSTRPVHARMRHLASFQRSLCFHFGGADIIPSLSIHALHGDMISKLIDDVDADRLPLLGCKIHAGVDDRARRRHVDLIEFVYFTSSLAGYDKLLGNILRRGAGGDAKCRCHRHPKDVLSHLALLCLRLNF